MTVVRGTGPDAAAAPAILLVEDDPALADAIRYALEREGFRVVLASDGEEGIACFRAHSPTLVLLDLMLPSQLSGLDVCRILRAESQVPIAILTAKDSEADTVAGLEVGADDYITKPFSMRELVARVRAHVRRAGMPLPAVDADVLKSGPVELDAARHEVRVRGRQVAFPRKEFELLEAFLQGRGRLRTRSFLIASVWGPDYFGDTKTLDVHVKRLRQKIERDPQNPEHLVTVRGLGYRFLDQPQTATYTGRVQLSRIDGSSARRGDPSSGEWALRGMAGEGKPPRTA